MLIPGQSSCFIAPRLGKFFWGLVSPFAGLFLGAKCLLMWDQGLALAGLARSLCCTRDSAEGQQMGDLFRSMVLYYQNYSVAVHKGTQSCLDFSFGD